MSSQQLIPPVPQIQHTQLDPEQEELRHERREARMERRKQRQRARFLLWSTIGTTVVLLGFIGVVFLQINAIINPAHLAINGIPCDGSGMTVQYHIHAHLTIYINGKKATVPKGIGIPTDNSCIYWLHTHTSDGIIHIEAPQQSNEALDDFLAIWTEGFPKLGYPPQLNLTTGWKVYIDGKLFTSAAVTSPVHTEIPLTSHEAITLEYGSNNPPPDKFYAFPADLPK